MPALTSKLERVVSELFSISVLRVGPGVKTGLSIQIPDPASVGADRL